MKSGNSVPQKVEENPAEKNLRVTENGLQVIESYQVPEASLKIGIVCSGVLK